MSFGTGSSSLQLEIRTRGNASDRQTSNCKGVAMNETNNAVLAAEYKQWTTERLTAALAKDRTDYRPEAITAMIAELRSRGETDPIVDTQQQTRETKKEEVEDKAGKMFCRVVAFAIMIIAYWNVKPWLDDNFKGVFMATIGGALFGGVAGAIAYPIAGSILKTWRKGRE